VACGRRLPWISLVGNVTMTLYKVTVGILGGSSALVADGLHSGTDVIGTSVILFTRGVSERPADTCHPYGHGKAEFMGAACIYTVLFFLSVGIFGSGLLMIIEGELGKPSLVTILAAGVSVGYNTIMYLYGRCAGRRNNSPALLANAFENRADAISSVACILGIGAALLIHPIFDPIAGMAVGVVIFMNCIEQMKESLGGLLDESMAPGSLQRLRELTCTVSGVQGIDFVKARPIGTDFWVDLGIVVDGNIDVAAGDEIARNVRTLLMRRTEEIGSVEVFVACEEQATGGANGP